MSGNLRERLQRIRCLSAAPQQEPCARDKGKTAAIGDSSAFAVQGWIPAGHLTLRREIAGDGGARGGDMVLPAAMPEAAGIVMPGMDAMTKYENLLFFDLETTGLSGGAGTVAFLAAFGRLVPSGSVCQLNITQYLLLDYPGEYDFVQAILGQIQCHNDITIVSYNGRNFDSQILKTRCLMNGIAPPEYRHADLLYPARRLWKRLLPDCSQGTIETNILGIDRTGDIPGAMAPDIWFTFLKTGDAAPLMGICEHNRRDISGLASIFCAMADIAADPFAAMNKINFDVEALAIRWSAITRQNRLLQIAAEMGHSHAELLLGQSLLKSGNYEEGREWLAKAASSDGPLSAQVAALRSLAIDSEWRLKDTAEARALAERGLELLPPNSSLRAEFERRLLRLRNR